MSEFRRRLMAQVASDPNALPDGCIRLEYIASNGIDVQYIDTERLVYDDEDIFVKHMFTVDKAMYGWRLGETWKEKNQCYIDLTGIRYGVSGDIRQPFTNNKIVTSFISPNSKVVIGDGFQYLTYQYDTTFSKAYVDGNSVITPYLFYLHKEGVTPTALHVTYIYEYSLTDPEGNYTQHLIPILDPDGTPCMYDTVSKKFHYNKGTGTFLYKIAE